MAKRNRTTVSKTLFFGCSGTSGQGFPLERNQPELWVNLLHQNTKLKNTELLNLSQGARSNPNIFHDAVYHLTNISNVEYAFIAYTSMPRFEVMLGLELHDATGALFVPGSPLCDYKLNDINYTANYLNNIRDRFTNLVHLHQEIVHLVHDVNSLLRLSKILNVKLYFINGQCPWDQDYFVRLDNVLPNKYTNFTKKLISVDNRDDDEIFKLYDKIHSEYDTAGGIQESRWLNLYNPLNKLKIDFNDDGTHAGVKSNYLFYEALKDAVELC